MQCEPLSRQSKKPLLQVKYAERRQRMEDELTGTPGFELLRSLVESKSIPVRAAMEGAEVSFEINEGVLDFSPDDSFVVRSDKSKLRFSGDLVQLSGPIIETGTAAVDVVTGVAFAW
jgi:hypothetical protein